MARVRWIVAAGAAALLLTALYIAFERSVAFGTQPVTRLARRYGRFQNNTGGAFLTPVGTVTYSWGSPREDSLVFAPLLPLSSLLKLSPDQETRITAVQQQTQQQILQERQLSEKRLDDIFRRLRDTQENSGRPVPFTDPVSGQINDFVERVTLPRRQAHMKSLHGQLLGAGMENSKRLHWIEESGSSEIAALLDDSQKAGLPRLLADMDTFRTLSLEPAARYATLNLSSDQRTRMAALARRVKNQRAQPPGPATPFDMTTSGLRHASLRMMPPRQRRAYRRQQIADNVRQIEDGRKAREEVRRKARREALAVLTDAQRQALARPTNLPLR